MTPAVFIRSGVFIGLACWPAFAAPVVSTASENPGTRRFFYSGDGKIDLYSDRTRLSYAGVYRNSDGSYDEKAVQKIHQVFGAPYKSSQMELSLRLVEYIDYLEDRLNKGARITLTSGFRNPAYNTMLRDRGNLAAKASLHQYGMAADLKIKGVKAVTIWETVKDLKFGGAGYYHGESMHIDVGPARSWDETTSGVGTTISDDNKLIGLITDFDVYTPQSGISLRFIRMTAFPISVKRRFSLLRQTKPGIFESHLDFEPIFNIPAKADCPSFENISEMNFIQWNLPGKIPSGRYKVRAEFCGDAWPEMPRQVETPEFEIR